MTFTIPTIIPPTVVKRVKINRGPDGIGIPSAGTTVKLSPLPSMTWAHRKEQVQKNMLAYTTEDWPFRIKKMKTNKERLMRIFTWADNLGLEPFACQKKDINKVIGYCDAVGSYLTEMILIVVTPYKRGGKIFVNGVYRINPDGLKLLRDNLHQIKPD